MNERRAPSLSENLKMLDPPLLSFILPHSLEIP